MEAPRKLSIQSHSSEEDIPQDRSKRQKVSFTRSTFADPAKPAQISTPTIISEDSSLGEDATKAHGSPPQAGTPAGSHSGHHEPVVDVENEDNLAQTPADQEYEELEEGDEIRHYDHDSAYDGDSFRGDDTGTMESFITDYRWENGRRYHAYRDGAYWGPNDEDANDQQDLAHHLYKLTLDNKLHLAPIGDNPHNILDVGTGTGIWAIEMADLYPSASVTGVDLSPIQPSFVPSNCHFELDDITLEWTYPANHFDFIHMRELFGSIPDWDFLLGQVYRSCRKGGWVEILEHAVTPVSDDDTVGPDTFYTLWGNTVIDLGEKSGKSFAIWKESKERLERAGFVDVHEVRYKWPMNGWPDDPKLKLLGQWNQLRLYDGVEGFMIRLLTITGGWSVARAQLHLQQMRDALKDFKIHAYLDVSVAYGRRPE